MQAFNGTYIKFTGTELSLNSPDGTASIAMEELKLFKKIAQMAKKEVNEQMRIIRAEATDRRATQGPASLGTGALLFKGTKLGSFFRTAGTIDRANERRRDQAELAPYEAEKRVIEKVLIGVAQFEITLKKELLTA